MVFKIHTICFGTSITVKTPLFYDLDCSYMTYVYLVSGIANRCVLNLDNLVKTSKYTTSIGKSQLLITFKIQSTNNLSDLLAI